MRIATVCASSKYVTKNQSLISGDFFNVTCILVQTKSIWTQNKNVKYFSSPVLGIVAAFIFFSQALSSPSNPANNTHPVPRWLCQSSMVSMEGAMIATLGCFPDMDWNMSVSFHHHTGGRAISNLLGKNIFFDAAHSDKDNAFMAGPTSIFCIC